MSEEEPKKKRLVSFADIAARQQEGAGREAGAVRRAGGGNAGERVTYADLAALSRRPEDFAPGTPVPATPESIPPAAETPEPTIPDKTAPEPAIPGSGVPVISEYRLGAIESGTPDTGIPAVGPPVTAIRLGRQIRQAMTARDGHSLGEQAVYDVLWNNAAPHTGTSRIVSVGYRPLSSLCRLTVNNCKANVQSLVRKLAVEEVAAHSYTQAKTYIVHSEAGIMRLRKTAGLTHYIKSRGIVFVDLETGLETGGPQTGTPEAVAAGSRKGVPGTGGAETPQA
jgi:hypothetical protein